jgi:BNR repeat-containing family member
MGSNSGQSSGRREHSQRLWQVAIDRQSAIHLSWVWRETGDVVTNHDIAYPVSKNGGKTWQKTTGDEYSVPIAMDEAEYAARIPQNSELANQTSMAVDEKGHPVIASFWRAAPDAVPQYHLLMHDGNRWIDRQVGQRTLNFFRKGGGTKKPPISRPLVLLETIAHGTRTHILFRDKERGGHITLASSNNLFSDDWTYANLTSSPVGQSDPMIDPDMWASQNTIHLVTQFTGQGDGEKQENVAPQMVSVVEWSPDEK